MYRSPAAAGPAGLPSWSVQDNIPASPPTDLDDDHLLRQFFDFEGYYGRASRASSAEPLPYASSPRSSPRYSPRSSPGSSPRALTTELINGIPTVAHRYRDSNPYGMASSYGAEYQSTGSDYAATPGLSTGDSSPSDSSGAGVDRFEEYHYLPSGDVQHFKSTIDDQWTYPQADPRASPRDYPDQVEVDHHYHASESSNGLKRRHSGHGPEKRSRHLVDRGQTADVRKSGACLPCRVSKTRCADSGVCPTCRKAFPDHAHLVCNRLTPGLSWPVFGKAPDIWSQTAEVEEQLCSGPRKYFGKLRNIEIFFADPRQTQSPSMRVVVQPYAHTNEEAEAARREGGSPNKVDFTRDEVPTWDKLQRWAESQLECERTTSFPHAVQNFVAAYANEGRGLPKHSLAVKVHQMNCFFRIWQTPWFCCRDPKNKLTSLPLSAQARLRNIARDALNRIEHDVLKKLDDCLTQNGAPKAEERMAIWACMWALMLMYRQLACATKSFIDDSAIHGGDRRTIQESMDFDRKMTGSFFPLMTMFYHYQFRMKKSVELSTDWDSKTLRHSARHMDEFRRGFYQSLQDSDEEIDQLLAVFVVAHEIKKLNARKRPSKATTRPSSAGTGSPASRSSGHRSSASRTSASRSSGSHSSGSSSRSRPSAGSSPEYYAAYYG